MSYETKENILTEAAILKYVTMNAKCPNSIIKYIDFFESDLNYYLIMENGGNNLFQFIQRIHKFIVCGHLKIKEWHKLAKIIFKQMIECIEYLHSINICHFDISLENFLISDINIVIYDGHISFIYDENKKRPIIKLCDFGLAQLFIDDSFKHSTHFCGKHNYMSPEIVNRQITFNAKSNDIWCLGVCLFMMIFGSGPFNKADIKNDECFQFIINGHLNGLIKAWKKDHYANKNLIKLFQSILKYQRHRATMDDIKNCSWLKDDE